MADRETTNEKPLGPSKTTHTFDPSNWRLNFLQPGHSTVKHRLDSARIVETADYLSRELGTQLPGSSLAGLADALAKIARAPDDQTRQARKPIYVLRAASAIAIGVAVVALALVARHVHARWEFATITDLFAGLQAGVNLLVLLAGALWFLVSIEARIKRRRTLQSIGELREFLHVIDVTQLYYTPDFYSAAPAMGKLKLDHTYLLCCTRMLGLIGNLAALHARGTSADSILRASFELELLANTITAKLQSKVESIRAKERPE